MAKKKTKWKKAIMLEKRKFITNLYDKWKKHQNENFKKIIHKIDISER